MASKTGGGSTAARNRAKNQEMAARLKASGDRRTHARCPICSKVVSIEQFATHLAYHPA